MHKLVENVIQFIKIIQEHVRAEFAGMGVKLPEGMHQGYNGINIFQTKDYIKVGAESYILIACFKPMDGMRLENMKAIPIQFLYGIHQSID